MKKPQEMTKKEMYQELRYLRRKMKEITEDGFIYGNWPLFYKFRGRGFDLIQELINRGTNKTFYRKVAPWYRQEELTENWIKANER
ncbi:hypothetical protein [Paludifilum halophilum]|uniref:Uncharacterized protein n=1 Tax=Paludifilum halophilum TaxID=1642702 RepID=A0A235B8E9_9BACL|nr:hypothetical protein [Paludifilum halophilum]OYD08556.1 hypothetical protein CHM34_06945 [Paludifilum halophilum]